MTPLAALDAKINALLPPRYQHCYRDVRMASMGTAGLKYGPDGRVAWDQVWTSFCDLALAGGPPHRGRLLEPVPADAVEAEPERAAAVATELGRAIALVTGLRVLFPPPLRGRVRVGGEAPRAESQPPDSGNFTPHPNPPPQGGRGPEQTDAGMLPGWVGVACESDVMAAWLTAAIVAENVSARRIDSTLLLPAGPAFRVEKEVKNVVTALAKANHYWADHAAADRWQASAALLSPVTPADNTHRAAVEAGVRSVCGWPTDGRGPGWVGVRSPDEAATVWLLRAVVVEGVLVRREGDVLCLPTGGTAEEARRVVGTFAAAFGLWQVRDG